LAVVGVVEGAQQIAMARYVLKSATKGTASLQDLCKEQHLDGASLRDALTVLVEKYQFKSKAETYNYYNSMMTTVYTIGNSTGICSVHNATTYDGPTWPDSFTYLDQAISNGIYSGLGVKMPIDKLEAYMEPIEIAEKSWWLTYLYFWSCFCLLIISLIVFLFLIRRHKVDLFDYVSILTRGLVLGAGGAMLAVLASQQRLVQILNSPFILPVCVVLLFIILTCDKLTSLWCNWRLTKSGEPYALEFEEEHHHGGHHDEEHGEVLLVTDPEAPRIHYGRPKLKNHRVSAGWSVSESVDLSNESTEYRSGHYRDNSYGLEDIQSPPLLSPSPPQTASGRRPGGYMPIES
jgi:hypothetical protein